MRVQDIEGYIHGIDNKERNEYREANNDENQVGVVKNESTG